MSTPWSMHSSEMYFRDVRCQLNALIFNGQLFLGLKKVVHPNIFNVIIQITWA